MRRVLGALGFGILIAGGGLLFLSFIQNHFIFHPTRAIEQTPQAAGLPFEQVRLQTSDGETISGWFVPLGSPAATVMLLHGNAGNISHRVFRLVGMHRAGFQVLIIDYRGYGESTGTPSEEGLLLDVRAAWEHLTRSRGLPPGKIAIYGVSLGSAPALELARRLEEKNERAPSALILEGAFTSALEMGQRAFPFLPVRWILRTRLDNLGAVRQVRTPTYFLHAGRDEVVPIDMGRRLYEASAASLKEFREVPMASHNTLWSGDGSILLADIRRFIEQAQSR